MSSERKSLKILCFVNFAVAVACAVCGVTSLLSGASAPWGMAQAGILVVGAVLCLRATGLGIQGANTPRKADGAKQAGIMQVVCVGCAWLAGVLGTQLGGAPLDVPVLVVEVLGVVFGVLVTTWSGKVLEQARD